jgi:hypothetical protein
MLRRGSSIDLAALVDQPDAVTAVSKLCLAPTAVE